MREIVESCHQAEKDKSRSLYLCSVLNLLGKAESTLGLNKAEFKNLKQRYSTAIKNLEEESKNEAENGYGKIIDYPAVLKTVWDSYNEQKIIYEKEFPGDSEILKFQDVIMALKQLVFPHNRGNDATLVNAFHEDANIKTDNVFIPAEDGTSVLIWNEGKQDRIKRGKRALDEEDVYDNTRYVQPMSATDLPHLDGQRVGEVLSRFVRRFRRNSKYIFLKKDGTPLMKEKDAKGRFAPIMREFRKQRVMELWTSAEVKSRMCAKQI
ncbi:hypothetical protein HDU87_002213 [Geranomyces variabilis]|uniref:Uncharacterized protein n=1 Tax=Geranomyces variabilis TaxID=109894 RepID=A0AAD5TBA8_9FUNG|nr:hypothetical protein HDU87_002213 [Geranomyces variabilis]